MTIEIRTIEGSVSVQVPGTDAPVEGRLSSCIYDGLTINIDSSPHIRALHELISSGQIMGLTLILKDDNV